MQHVIYIYKNAAWSIYQAEVIEQASHFSSENFITPGWAIFNMQSEVVSNRFTLTSEHTHSIPPLSKIH